MPKRVVPPGEGRRVPIMGRTTPELRTRLEKAAAASGRSLALELEHRIEQSFAIVDKSKEMATFYVEQMLGDDNLQDILLTAKNIVDMIEKIESKSWQSDNEIELTCLLAMRYWMHVLAIGAGRELDSDLRIHLKNKAALLVRAYAKLMNGPEGSASEVMEEIEALDRELESVEADQTEGDADPEATLLSGASAGSLKRKRQN